MEKKLETAIINGVCAYPYIYVSIYIGDVLGFIGNYSDSSFHFFSLIPIYPH